MNHILSLTQDDHLPWAGSYMKLIRQELGENGVLVLHEGLHTNGDTPKPSTVGKGYLYFYKEQRKVAALVNRLHHHGLKCVMYVHPGKCSKLMHWADTLAMIDRHIEAFNLDGVFLDGCHFHNGVLRSDDMTEIMRRFRSYYDVLVMHASVPVWAYKRFTPASKDSLAQCETISIDEWMYLATHVLLGEVNYDMGGRIVEGPLDPWFRHMKRQIADQYYASRFKEREFSHWHHSHIALKPTPDSSYDFDTMVDQYDAGDTGPVRKFYSEAFQTGACCYLGPWGIRRQFVSKYYKEMGDA